MPISIGKEEALIMIGLAGVAASAFTVVGRWSGRRAARIEEARREAKREQKDQDRIERLEQWRWAHTEETEPLKKQFQEYREITQATTLNVEHLATRVEDLVRSGESTLEEMRELARTVRGLLTGEIPWKGAAPSRGRPGTPS